MMRSPASLIPSFAARFTRNADGVAAVEFALVVPVLIVCYFGLAEFCQAYMAQKRAQHTTSQIADMIARAPDTTRAELDAIFDVGSLIMQPFPEAGLSIRVTSITRGTDGVARVDWSRGRGLTGLSGVQTVPAGLIANGETIIMSETRYAFDSSMNRLLPGLTNFNGRYFLRPRLSDRLPCTDC